MKMDDNQSGNSTIFGGCRQWIRCYGILLQRNGFSRESARFIKENPEYVVKDGSTGKLKLKASLSKCGRTSVENEVEYIRQNIPGIFVDEED